ncbi:hypothetical protein C0991_001743, partial [Blastosporella zonata]
MWRPHKVSKKPHNLLNVTVRHVVRKTMGAEIQEELKRLLSVDELSNSSQAAFTKYNVALRNVMNNLTPEDETRLRQTAAEWTKKGNPIHVQK